MTNRSQILQLIQSFADEEMSLASCWAALEPIRVERHYQKDFDSVELERLQKWFTQLDMGSDDRHVPSTFREKIKNFKEDTFGEYALPIETVRCNAKKLLEMIN